MTFPINARSWNTWRGVAVGAVLCLTLLLASVPYLHGYWGRPAGTLFWAVPPVNSSDANQYLAFTRAVSEGAFLVGDPFTAEPHPPRLLMPQVLLQGWVCRLFGWSPLAAFQVSRVVSGGALLLSGWWFGTLFLRSWRQRWLYLGLLCFSAGAGWFVERAGWDLPHGDLIQPEGNTFFTLGNLPHLALSATLMTALFGTLRAVEIEKSSSTRRIGGWLIGTLALSMLLSWTHPFDYLTLGLGLGSYVLVCWASRRELPAASLLHGVALVAGALPAGLYLLWVTRTDLVYAALTSDSLSVNSFAFYAIAHAPLALPALVVLVRPELRARYALPLCWVLCVFLFLLTPWRMGGKQPRLVGGVHVPLALLATAGIGYLGQQFARLVRPGAGRRFLRAAVAGTFFLLAATGAWAMLERHSEYYTQAQRNPRRRPAVYMRTDVQGLFEHLASEGDATQLTLGGGYTGGWAPVLADARVFHGHWHMTLNEPAKRAEVVWFFLQPDDPVRKAAWLRDRGVTWVIRYPWEWDNNAVPLDQVPGLYPAYITPEIQLYRFQPGR
ncbi:MAG TPA: hypothetical protein VK689_04145 [Armatimonadota bacterium]|nr:hypothetical protein [Armatimonadota bacterium]